MVNDKLKKDIEELIEALENIKKKNVKAVMGLDGFVDEILHVVETRMDANTYTRMNTLQEFGEKICKAAGLSTNIEFIPIKSKLGGNGPIMSNALSSYGVDITYIGALGTPNINPVFKEMGEKWGVISIANPGLTDAVEFLDGKLMIGKRESLKEVRWQTLKEKVGIDNLTAIIQEAKLVGLENWTMLPYMTEIWRGIINEVLPRLEERADHRFIFFDLADPENRLKEDVIEALEVIKEFSSKFNVILGLNEKEAVEISEVLGLTEPNTNVKLEDIVIGVANELHIYCLVVHPVKEAMAVMGGKYYHTFGPFDPNPKLTTGAGDNFNAGFCLGQSLGLSPQLSLILGTATSGYYVRNAESPTMESVIEFLKSWKDIIIK